MRELAREAGIRCPRCRTTDCARRHAVRRRKRVIDLSTGQTFENLPIVRVIFCDGSTASCCPAELWRGRSTVSSVVESVCHLLGQGIAAAREWVLYGGEGEELLSDRTLYRWRDLVRSRLVGASLAWLGPRLGICWSDGEPEAPQLERLLDRLEPTDLLAFRAATSRSVLDTASRPTALPRSPARPIPGRFAPAPPHDPPQVLLPRGARLRRTGRDPPRR